MSEDNGGFLPLPKNILKNYRISANSFRGNYSFLEDGVRQLFKGGNYSREETINLLGFFVSIHDLNTSRTYF